MKTAPPGRNAPLGAWPRRAVLCVVALASLGGGAAARSAGVPGDGAAEAARADAGRGRNLQPAVVVCVVKDDCEGYKECLPTSSSWGKCACTPTGTPAGVANMCKRKKFDCNNKGKSWGCDDPEQCQYSDAAWDVCPTLPGACQNVDAVWGVCAVPTPAPTGAPTALLTPPPTTSPFGSPSAAPSDSPSAAPSAAASVSPSAAAPSPSGPLPPPIVTIAPTYPPTPVDVTPFPTRAPTTPPTVTDTSEPTGGSSERRDESCIEDADCNPLTQCPVPSPEVQPGDKCKCKQGMCRKKYEDCQMAGPQSLQWPCSVWDECNPMKFNTDPMYENWGVCEPLSAKRPKCGNESHCWGGFRDCAAGNLLCVCLKNKCRKKLYDCKPSSNNGKWECVPGKWCDVHINQLGKPMPWGVCKVVGTPA